MQHTQTIDLLGLFFMICLLKDPIESIFSINKFKKHLKNL